MNQTDRIYKQLVEESKKYLSTAIQRYNKAKTERAKLWKIILMYRHFFKTASKLCMIHPDILEILREEKTPQKESSEDDKFFGTHIRKLTRTIKKIFGRKKDGEVRENIEKTAR